MNQNPKIHFSTLKSNLFPSVKIEIENYQSKIRD